MMTSSLTSIDPSAARSIVVRPKCVPTRGLQMKSKLMHSTHAGTDWENWRCSRSPSCEASLYARLCCHRDTVTPVSELRISRKPQPLSSGGLLADVVGG